MSMIGKFLAIKDNELTLLYENPETISTILYEKYTDQILDIDKTWHGIHYLLTGKQYGGEPPLANVVFGIKPIGEVDVGYSPAMGTPASFVREIAASLNSVSVDDFKGFFNKDALISDEIYPQIWYEGEDAMDYLVTYFNELCEFYKTAAENGHAVITFIN